MLGRVGQAFVRAGEASVHAVTNGARVVGEAAGAAATETLAAANKANVGENMGLVLGNETVDAFQRFARKVTARLPETMRGAAEGAATSLAAITTSTAGSVVEHAATGVKNQVVKGALDAVGSTVKGTGAGVIAHQTMDVAGEVGAGIVKGVRAR